MADYDAMKQLALRMRTSKHGVVLGYSSRLDAGLEAVYYNDLPFVLGRGGMNLFGRKEVEKLIHDFHISYVWTDDDLVDKLRAWFPRSSVVMSRAPLLRAGRETERGAGRRFARGVTDPGARSQPMKGGKSG